MGENRGEVIAHAQHSMGAAWHVCAPPMMGPRAVVLLAAAGTAVAATSAPLAEINRSCVSSARPLHIPTTPHDALLRPVRILRNVDTRCKSAMHTMVCAEARCQQHKRKDMCKHQSRLPSERALLKACCIGSTKRGGLAHC